MWCPLEYERARILTHELTEILKELFGAENSSRGVKIKENGAPRHIIIGGAPWWEQQPTTTQQFGTWIKKAHGKKSKSKSK